MKAKTLKPPRKGPKGRQWDAGALSEVQALLADAPREACLLIEFLHRIQDACGQISAAPICGIDADMIRTVARAYATASAAMILWGIGVSQHTHGTDNARFEVFWQATLDDKSDVRPRFAACVRGLVQA
jgi:hypothetical protein